MSIDPFVPAGTIAAFATICPFSAFSVETIGCGWPDGQVLRYPSGPLGTTVKLRENACTLAGGAQRLSANGIDRVVAALILGGPNDPLVPCPERVSVARHGWTG